MEYDISKIMNAIRGVFTQKQTESKQSGKVISGKLISGSIKPTLVSRSKSLTPIINNTPYIDLGYPINPDQVLNEKKEKAIGVFSFPDGTIEKPRLHNEGGLL